MNEINIETLLEKLAGIIRLGKKPVFGAGKIIDDNECFKLIEEIKTVLPNDIADARVILKDKERLVAEAQGQADLILSQAEADANRMLNENEIILQAQSEAQKIVAAAQSYANGVIEQSYAKIAEIMQSTESYLKKTLDDVTAAKYELFNLMNNNAPKHH